jgi:hypothetical protein
MLLNIVIIDQYGTGKNMPQCGADHQIKTASMTFATDHWRHIHG